MRSGYTSEDWIFLFQREENPNSYDFEVLRGPVSIQILKEKVEKILKEQPFEKGIYFYEDIKMIIFRPWLDVEQVKVLQGVCS